jgi:hypothetical protein
MSAIKLLDAVIQATVGAATEAPTVGDEHVKPDQTFQATVVGSGAVAATVLIQFSNDNVGWLTGATITLSGTTSASDGFASNASWKYKRANLTAISGTNAACTVTMGV